MAEEFEDRDLSGSVFWGVRLKGATFRDTDFSGSTFFHTLWNDVSIDGVIERLVINGVDVTEHVNAHDKWHPLRTRLEPRTEEELRDAWSDILARWRRVFERAEAMPGDVTGTSVNGEWSLRDTMRHMLFVMDKWFALPLLGESTFSPNGLPNTGSVGHPWPGIDLSSDPSYADVLTEFDTSVARFNDHIGAVDFGTLPGSVEIEENGTVPAVMCYHVVLEEFFEHLRYASRDLDLLDAP